MQPNLDRRAGMAGALMWLLGWGNGLIHGLMFGKRPKPEPSLSIRLLEVPHVADSHWIVAGGNRVVYIDRAVRNDQGMLVDVLYLDCSIIDPSKIHSELM